MTPRATAGAALGLLLAACNKSEVTATSSTATPPPIASTTAPAVSFATPAPKGSTSAVSVPEASSRTMLPAGKVLDTSDWRGAPLGSTLYVLWTVDQTRARPPVKGGDLTKYEVPLELTLALNGHPHTVLLETDAASAYSGTCPGVAFFYAGIDIAFRLLRTEGGGAVLTRTVTSESSPTKSELLYAFEMPTDVRVSQELVTAGPDGTRSVTSCTAVALP